MESILQWLANCLCRYGVWAVGLYSFHGTFEESVPEKLVQIHTEKKRHAAKPKI